MAAAGPVGRDLLAVDWSATPLGPPPGWPNSLKVIVRALLTSRFSMWMAWGPELTFFCNDAYRRDTLGQKYPWALGKPASVVWSEIWSDIGPRIGSVLAQGLATWDEDLMLFLERSGFVEETYHTFSYSPLSGDDGAVAGMLCVVSEETQRVIGERRMATLRDLGSDLMSRHSEAEVLRAARRHLGGNDRDFPFGLVYLLDPEQGLARLAAATGVPKGHPVAPALLAADSEGPWPVSRAGQGKATLVELARSFPDLGPGDIPSGQWSEPPRRALVSPLRPQGDGPPYGFVVAALNPYRPLDAGYQGFIDLVAGQLAAGIASARAYDAERRRAEQLAELDRAKTAFFTNVSHEFRTPLTLLLGPAEDALADGGFPLPEPQRVRLELIRSNGQRLLQLVNTLLDFSHLESGRAPIRYAPVDLARYTRELAVMFEPATARAGLDLRVGCEPLPGPVYVDADMWAKIVLNLVSNALKFTFSGGISVRLRPLGDGEVELAVSDTGIGIAAADQPRLFERFHRVMGARSRSFEGSGIGLALVAELVRLHGGRVGVTSALGEGSTFTVTVPVGGPELVGGEPAAAPEETGLSPQAQALVGEALRWLAQEDQEPASGGARPGRASGGARPGGASGGARPGGASGGARPGGASGGARPGGASGGARPGGTAGGASDEGRGRPRVLVADDNTEMRTYLASVLGAEYEVVSAPDGAAALDMARADPPDLVLTDVMMPGLDGFALLRALRDDPATADVPVVMVSARAGDDGVVEGLQAGADDYLAKPFSARELLARVRSNVELDRARRAREQLERSQALLAQAQRIARLGSWELNLVDRRISASDEFYRLMGVHPDEIRTGGLERALRSVHPEDLPAVLAALAEARQGVAPDLTFRLVAPSGEVRHVRARAELDRNEEAQVVSVRGSVQDVTDQRQAERALAEAAAQREALAREHQIADQLQASLLPVPASSHDHLEVATYYQAGVEGTYVGGDWYDVIELGAGRTALVIGDVMGRGVRAAAVMGQLRSAVRAYARIDLPPADVLELLDGVTRDLGEDQIVTCLYAAYDPADRSLTYANAGHLPALLRDAEGGMVTRLDEVGGPPLGTGPFTLTEGRVVVPPTGTVVFYTDGLVENRQRDLDRGVAELARHFSQLGGPLVDQPAALVRALLPEEPDDDIAVLVARVPEEPQRLVASAWTIEPEGHAVQAARDSVAATLAEWGVQDELVDDVVLVVSELVTNAVVYARPPIVLRLRRTVRYIVVEVSDGASFLPRKLRPALDDEHGRGLQLIAALADRWGTRPVPTGKSVWCLFLLARDPEAVGRRLIESLGDL